jgi:chemotaxis protein MotB
MTLEESRMKSVFLALPLLLTLSACVTTGKYNALMKSNEELQSQLDLTHQSAQNLQGELGETKQSKQALEQEKSTLQSEKSGLEKAKGSLESEKTELEHLTAQLTAQKAQLQAEKDALLADSMAKKAQYDSLVGQLQNEVTAGNLKITQYKNMLTVDVADKILFDSGKAALKADGQSVLKNVADALAKNEKYIRVVGHTDNVPLSAGAAYASNWELSAARATTVVRFLQEQGKLDPKRLMAAGRGEFAPVAPNDSPANKQKNRRIEITLLDRNLVEAVIDKPAEAGAQP